MLLPQERIPWLLRKLAFRSDILFRLRSPYCEADTAEADTSILPPPGPYCEADTAKPILHTPRSAVYLTFDDGPIPESTPWLLETLRQHGAKATFFMVADNARRYPDLFKAVVDAGHAIGNHTYHHRPPVRQSTEELLADVRQAEEVLWEGAFPSSQDCVAMEGRFATAPSRPGARLSDCVAMERRASGRRPRPGARLFRPPHGLIWPHQQKALQKEGYRIVMFDLNTLDYRQDRTPQQILNSVKRNVRPGCIINLHDSLKSIDKLKQCLPEILEFLQQSGYAMEALPSR